MNVDLYIGVGVRIGEGVRIGVGIGVRRAVDLWEDRSRESSRPV